MARLLDITSLELNALADGRSTVRVNLTCYSTEDVDDVAAWLGFVKEAMVQWEDIRNSETPRPRDPSRVERGRNGGEARAAALSPERRSEIATEAANARWKGNKE